MQSANSDQSQFNVQSFGAKGDGVTVDTAAIQAAIDAAGKVSGTVFFPPGIYCTSMLRVPHHTGLMGHPTWGYKTTGLTIPFNVCWNERSSSELSGWAPYSKRRFYAPDEFGRLVLGK